MRLGWSHGDQEIFSLKEMIELFDLKNVSRSAASLNTDKLNWLNAHYIGAMPIEKLAQHFTSYIDEQGWDIASGPEAQSVIPELIQRYKTIKAMALGAKFLYSDDIAWNEKDQLKYFVTDNKDMLCTLFEQLEKRPDWHQQELKTAIDQVLEEHKIKLGKLGKPLRFILTANAPSPDLATTLEWIGRSRSLQRIKRALNQFK